MGWYLNEDIEAVLLTLRSGERQLRVVLRARTEGPDQRRGTVIAAFTDNAAYEAFMEAPETERYQNYFGVPPLEVTRGEFTEWLHRAGLTENSCGKEAGHGTSGE